MTGTVVSSKNLAMILCFMDIRATNGLKHQGYTDQLLRPSNQQHLMAATMYNNDELE